MIKFSMPYGEILEIRPSKEIDEDQIESDEVVEGVVYNIYWGDKMMPYCTNTILQAYAVALGCQWGAQELHKKRIFG